MKAVYVKNFGGAENLEIREVENLPHPNKNQILVAVKASALNRADILQRKGLYPAPKGYPERILGLEFAGEIVKTGKSVSDFKIGDRVFGITAGGAQAEFILSDSNHLTKIPANLTFTEAAAIPEAFITAHDALFSLGQLNNGESILIHAVGSGVGLAALQLAKANGAKVLGTSRTQVKLDRCRQFGLDEGILADDNLSEKVKNLTDNRGVDVVLDLVGAKYFQNNLDVLALKGRLILVGLTGGAKAEFNLGTALTKRLKIIGTVLRSRSAQEKAEATAAFAKNVIPLIESKRIFPNVDRVFRLEEIRQAHGYLESNQSFGKVILNFEN